MIQHENWLARIFISLLLVLMFAGCAPTTTRESTGEFIDDSAITANVKAAIYDDAELKIGQISVQTFKGIVQLSGFVNTPAAVSKAGKLAAAAKGVVSVKNSLVVK